jgi:HAD superfamily phosphatase
LLVFDMDGVLVDVSESYRETIQRTVEHFTGQKITRAHIQDYKNAGGWNSDWHLSQKIAADLGCPVDLQDVIPVFQELFLGRDNDGLIQRERWIALPGLFERLQNRFTLALFTGRPRLEAKITLDRFAPRIRFETWICEEDVTHHKPNPEGLLKIRAMYADADCWYVGDTVDDARSARDAGVGFIGIASPANPRHGELVSVLQAAGAIAVLDDINLLEGVLPT